MSNSPAQNKINTHEHKNNNTLSVSDAAKLLHISPSTLRRLEKRGHITAKRLDNGYRVFKLGDLIQLKEQLEQLKTVSKISDTAKSKETKNPTQQPKKSDEPRTKDKITIKKSRSRDLTGFIFGTVLVVILLVHNLGGDTIVQNCISDTTNERCIQVTKITNEIGSLYELYKLNSKTAANFANLKHTTEDAVGTVLGKRSKNPNFIFNVNTKAIFKENVEIKKELNVAELSTLLGGLTTHNANGDFGTGTVTVGNLTFTTPGSITNLQTFDEISEDTFEELIDINGDVVGIGLTDVRVVGLNGMDLGDFDDTDDGNILMFDNDTLESVPQTEITELGTIDTGTWEADEIEPAYGGTGITSYNTGDILYASGSSTLDTLPIGTTNYVLASTGSLPSWVNVGTITGSWLLAGNAGIDPTTNFLGTTDTQPVNFRTNNTTRMTIASGGNIGIGTTTPLQALDVRGTIRLGTAGAGNTLNTTAGAAPTGDLYWGSRTICDATGNCASSGTQMGGSGTTNYLAKFTGQYTIGNSILYEDGSSIGIGTTNPGQELDVIGEIQWGTGTNLGQLRTTTDYVGIATPTNYAGWRIIFGATANDENMYFRNSDSDDYFVWDINGVTERMRLTGAGLLGIGTSSPLQALDVHGAIRLGTEGTGNILNTTVSGTAPTGDLYWGSRTLCDDSGNCAGTAASIGGSGTTNYLAKFTGQYTIGDSLLYDNGTGVGIGTTNPGAYALNIVGGLNTDAVYLSGTQVTSTATELNYLDGTTVEDGGVLFGNGTYIAQDTANFYWDNSNNRLGIGTTNPTASIEITYTPSINLDVDNTGGATGIVLTDGDWQSFTPTVSGYLNRVWTHSYWRMYSITMEIRQGEGSGGTLLATQSDTFTGEWAVGRLMVFDTPAYLTSGQTYTIVWTSVSQNNAVRSDGYSGGRNNGSPTEDYSFGTYMSTSSDNSLKLGDWSNGSSISSAYDLILNSTGNIVLQDTTGNVGIGTTSPLQALDVTGAIRLGTAGTGNILNTTVSGTAPTGDLYWGSRTLCDSTGNCASTGTQVGGSGTTNYLAKFTGQYTIGDSLLYDNGTGVGIGTTSPLQALDVTGAIRLGTAGTGNILNTTVSGTAPTGNLYWGSRTLCDDTGNCASTGTQVGGSGTTNYLAKFTGQYTIGDAVLYDDGSFIGLGTTNPSALLHIYNNSSLDDGKIRITTDLTGTVMDSDWSLGNTTGYNSNFTLHDHTNDKTPFVAAANANDYSIFINTSEVVFNENGVDLDYRFESSAAGAALFVQGSNGNVGIGTSSPLQVLDVHGAIRLGTSGTGNILNTTVSGTAPTGNLYWGSRTLCDDTGNCAGTAASMGGSGTTNYLAKFTGQYTIGDSILYDNGTGVGIGTTNPTSFLLELAGDMGPTANDTYDLGSTTQRWHDLYLGSSTIHIGDDSYDEATLLYNTSDNTFNINVLPPEALDATYGDTSGGGGSRTATWWGQSFTALYDGYLTKAGFVGNGSGTTSTCTMEIYSGEGSGGTLLGSATDTFTVSTNWDDFTFSEAQRAPITAGNTYTVTLSCGNAVGIKYEASNPYSGGHLMYPTENTDEDLRFRTYATRTTPQYTLTNTGSMGIGTTAPDGTLHIFSGSAGSVTANSVANELVVESAGTGGISILTPDASSGALVFGSPTDNLDAAITWNGSDALMKVGTWDTNGELALMSADSVEAMRINSSGYVGIGTTSPEGLLHILGAGGATGGMEIGSSNESFNMYFVDDSADSNFYLTYGGSGGADIVIGSTGDVSIGGGPVGTAVKFQVQGGTDNVAAKFSGTNADGVRASIMANDTARFGAFYTYDENDGGSGSYAKTFVGQYADSSLALTVDPSNGYVGVGDSSPEVRLHVLETGGQSTIKIEATGDNNTALSFETNAAQKAIIGYLAADNALKLSHSEAGTTLNDDQLILKEGYVGIGTLTPDGALDISSSGSPSIYLQTTAASSNSPILHLIGARTAEGGILAQLDFYNNESSDDGNPNARILSEKGASVDSGSISLLTRTNNAGSLTVGIELTENQEVYMLPVYSDTVGGTNRDLYIDNTGKLGYVSSSRRYKKNITDISDTSWLYDLRPVEFDYKQDDVHSWGLIAEEVETVKEELVSYNEDGEPETVSYSKLVIPMLAELQNLTEDVDDIREVIGTGGIDIATTTIQQITELLAELQEFTTTLGLTVDSDTNSLVVNTDMNVLGNATFADVTITGDIDMGLIQVDTLNTAININSTACYNKDTQTKNEGLCEVNTLHIQENLAGNLDIFDGQIVFEPDGTLIVRGEVAADKYAVNTAADNPSAGKDTIKAGDTTLEIETGSLTENSMILVTPEIPVAVGSKITEKNRFEVILNEALEEDITINWWIVN